MIRQRSLCGLRIVDLSMGWAGPLATRHLADLGAEVIKVESCTRFDWFRGWEASARWIRENGAEKHPPFNVMNRNKYGVTLDLATSRGRDLLLRLVKVSDAVVENFASSVLPKLRLGYEVFRKVNPDIVMVSMPGFGTTGPWRNYRAYGSTTEQGAGLPHLSGPPDGPPMMVHIALGDAVAGLHGAAALLAALRHQNRTGRGQFVDLSHAESLFPLHADAFAHKAVIGEAPARLGNRSRHFAPHGVYPCPDRRWIVIQVQNDRQWRRVQYHLRPALDDFGDLADRLERIDELDDAVARWTSGLDVEVAMGVLQACGVAAATVRRSDQLWMDLHLDARHAWCVANRRYSGKILHHIGPYRLEGDTPGLVAPSPTLGQHNREVLEGILGLSSREIASLERDGVIGTRPKLQERKST